MLRPQYLVLAILCTTAFTVPFLANAVNPDPALLLMTKLQSQATALGNGCFYPVLIRMNITYVGDNLYPIGLSNFWLVVTSRNVVISNTTNISYQNPTNTIGEFVLFPQIPVSLILSFPRTCLTSGIGSVRLLYIDGTYSYSFQLP